MTYPLIVNRVMGLCAFQPDVDGSQVDIVRSQAEIADHFSEQLTAIASDTLDPMFSSIVMKADEFDTPLERRPAAYEELDLAVTRGLEGRKLAGPLFADEPDRLDPAPVRDPLVGKFRPRHYRMRIGADTWNLQVRPSVTACLLESQERLGKLWLTFEGVPEEGTSGNRDAASRFADVTTALAEAALPKLREGYAKSLQNVTQRARSALRFNDVRLRVTFADTVDRGFSRLIDAMNLGGAEFTDVAEGVVGAEPQAGADDVVRFVTQINRQRPDPDFIETERGSGGSAAVFALGVKEADTAPDAERFVISGLASSVGLLSNSRSIDPAWQQEASSPELLRSISAARPISAWLADTAARRLDRRLAAPAPG